MSSFVRFTNARLLYDRLDERLEWKHGQTYVPKGNKRLLCLVDDINLSQVSWTNKNLEFLKNIHRNIKVNCSFCLISQKRKLNCFIFWDENFFIKNDIWSLLSLEFTTFLPLGWLVRTADGCGAGERTHWWRWLLQPGHTRVALRQQCDVLHHGQSKHHR